MKTIFSQVAQRSTDTPRQGTRTLQMKLRRQLWKLKAIIAFGDNVYSRIERWDDYKHRQKLAAETAQP